MTFFPLAFVPSLIFFYSLTFFFLLAEIFHLFCTPTSIAKTNAWTKQRYYYGSSMLFFMSDL